MNRVATAIDCHAPLVSACETALAYLTNPNYCEPEEAVTQLITALVAAGHDKALLDKCAKATWHPNPHIIINAELLDVCKESVRLTEETFRDDPSEMSADWVPNFNAMRAAVAKAEGRSE